MLMGKADYWQSKSLWKINQISGCKKGYYAGCDICVNYNAG